jgi:ABC-type branched-subunit amino acid transport system permease subunit
MKLLDNLYIIFLCLTREDDLGDRHKRAAAFLEMTSTFILSSITMVIFGFLNFRLTNFILWVLTIAVYGITSYFFFNKYFIRSGKYKALINSVSQYSQGKKITNAFIAIFLVIISFGLLVGGGILMSFLYSI